MAYFRKMYIGIGNTSRRIRKMYIGVNGKARKVKKVYVGVDGVARLAYMSTLFNTNVKMSSYRTNMTTGSVGNYILFVGGYDYSNNNAKCKIVNAFNTSLTQSLPTELSTEISNACSANVGNYVVFAGGYQTVVNAYNKSLTRSILTELEIPMSNGSSASVGNYALFGGGWSNGWGNLDEMFAYNTSLTYSRPSNLSLARTGVRASSVGNYALFAGGYQDGHDEVYVKIVDAYDTSLTTSTVTELNTVSSSIGTAHISNYALFAGGYWLITDTNYGYSNLINAYNSSLTRSNPTGLSTYRSSTLGISINNKAMFIGGNMGYSNGYSYYSDDVDLYSASLTRSNPTTLDNKYSALKGGSVGNYAVFTGQYLDPTLYSYLVSS